MRNRWRFAFGLATALLATQGWAAAPQHAVVDASSLQAGVRTDRFIVKLRAGGATPLGASRLEAVLQRVIAAMPRRVDQPAQTLHHVRPMAMGADVIRSGVPLDRAEAEELMRRIAADPDVASIEIDAVMQPSLIPNDPQFPDQWHLASEATGAIDAWDFANGSGVVVAVVDTGIIRHSDLEANILPGYDFIEELVRANDGDGPDDDPSDPGDWRDANACGTSDPVRPSSWHGTNLAGAIVAVTNNAKGVAGLAHGARVVPVRISGRCGSVTSDVVDGITWASGGTVPDAPANPHPAEVLNLSFGGSGACGAVMQEALDGAAQRGATIVVAAGNSAQDSADVAPANCRNVIVVAGVTRQGERAQSSNYGAAIDIAAPSQQILTTGNTGLTHAEQENISAERGTSMAAALVSGVVALMQSATERQRTPAEIEALLKASAAMFPGLPSHPIGAGIVDAQAAVEAVRKADAERLQATYAVIFSDDGEL